MNFLLVFIVLSVSAQELLQITDKRHKRIELDTYATFCSNPAKEMILKFDDIPAPQGYPGGLPQPYNSYIFARVNTPYSSWPDNHVPVLNTSTIIQGTTAYVNASVSHPNVLLTTGESLSLSKQVDRGTRLFTLLSFYATSVYLNNMVIFVNSFNSGVLVNTTTAVLPLKVHTQIMVNMKNIDTILIGCVNPDFNNCYPYVYDNFNVC